MKDLCQKWKVNYFLRRLQTARNRDWLTAEDRDQLRNPTLVSSMGLYFTFHLYMFVRRSAL